MSKKLDPSQKIDTFISPHRPKIKEQAAELRKVLDGICKEMEIETAVLHFMPEHTAVWARLFPNEMPGQRAEINLLLTPTHCAFFVGHPFGRDSIVVHSKELADPSALSGDDMMEGMMMSVKALLGPVDTERAGKLRLIIKPWHVGGDA